MELVGWARGDRERQLNTEGTEGTERETERAWWALGLGGVGWTCGSAAWSFGGAAFPTPPCFFSTSLLPPAATVCTWAWLVATQRCVCVAYDCLAVASAAGGVMGLGRKFSIRRVVVSVAIGVMVATLADVGVRVAIDPRQTLGKNVPFGVRADQPVVWFPDQRGLAGYRFTTVFFDFMSYNTGLVIDAQPDTWGSARPVPAWVATDAGPLQATTGSWSCDGSAYGMPLRSSVSERYTDVAFYSDMSPVTVWGGDIWYISGPPVMPRTLRIRILPALFNIACFTVVAWAALTGVAAVRRARRRSHGACAVCGYAIGTLAVCPECGTAARGGAALAASPTGGGVMSGTDGPNDS